MMREVGFKAFDFALFEVRQYMALMLCTHVNGNGCVYVKRFWAVTYVSYLYNLQCNLDWQFCPVIAQPVLIMVLPYCLEE
jgi:hypothetical protein